MSESNIQSQSSWLKWWPAFLGGFCAPLFGRLLAHRLPVHFAMGAAFAVVWFVVSLLLSKNSPPKWGLPPLLVALLAGCGGGLAVGLLYFLFPAN